MQKRIEMYVSITFELVVYIIIIYKPDLYIRIKFLV